MSTQQQKEAKIHNPVIIFGYQKREFDLEYVLIHINW